MGDRNVSLLFERFKGIVGRFLPLCDHGIDPNAKLSDSQIDGTAAQRDCGVNFRLKYRNGRLLFVGLCEFVEPTIEFIAIEVPLTTAFGAPGFASQVALRHLEPSFFALCAQPCLSFAKTNTEFIRRPVDAFTKCRLRQASRRSRLRKDHPRK